MNENVESEDDAMPHPRGVWIWYLNKIRQDYLQKLTAINCRRVYLKTLDDASAGLFWSGNCSRDSIKQFTDLGIEVFGWGYIFDNRTKTDTKAILLAAERTIDCGCSGFVFDVETEIKDTNTHKQLKEILEGSRDLIPDGNLGYTSFGHPGFHREIPWKLLFDACDLQFPQMYYEKWNFGASNKAEVGAAMRAHKELGLSGKPILPIWGSESDTRSDRATSAIELQWFLDNYPGSSVWRVPNIGERGQAWNVDYSVIHTGDVK